MISGKLPKAMNLTNKRLSNQASIDTAVVAPGQLPACLELRCSSSRSCSQREETSRSLRRSGASPSGGELRDGPREGWRGRGWMGGRGWGVGGGGGVGAGGWGDGGGERFGAQSDQRIKSTPTGTCRRSQSRKVQNQPPKVATGAWVAGMNSTRGKTGWTAPQAGSRTCACPP